MRKPVILGGTKGLGLALAREAATRDMQPVIVGRSAPVFLPEQGIAADSVLFVEADLSWQHGREEALRSCADADVVFWVAGQWLLRSAAATPDDAAQRMLALQVEGFEQCLRRLHHARTLAGKPYHLVVIASTSAHRLRVDEAVYCGVKAFQHHYTKNLGVELLRDLPGSKVTLVCPGGMRTAFFADVHRDVSEFMDPASVARLIWQHVERSAPPLLELVIWRGTAGAPEPSVVDWTPEALALLPARQP